MLKKAVQRGRGESKPEAYPQGYVEDFDEPRTKLAGFFSILLDRILKDRLRPNRLRQDPTPLELLKNSSSRRIEIRWA